MGFLKALAIGMGALSLITLGSCVIVSQAAVAVADKAGDDISRGTGSFLNEMARQEKADRDRLKAQRVRPEDFTKPSIQFED
jgi:hypothetical protein